MAPRSTPPPPLSKGTYYPPNDAATYRDLLLFEERLKTNAASLSRRKRRYQLLLLHLLLVILFLLSQVFLQLNLLDIPYKLLLRATLPTIYNDPAALVTAHVHPYVNSGLLFVSVTTLVLFFASGMYSEKIGYANRYVPHANRALRNFNMYLNLRQPALRSLNPFSFARSTPPLTSPRPPSPSPSRSPISKRSASSVPIPTIPPSTNPRGELIFSSKVDRTFRDSYERYRAAFERKREEREKEAFFTRTLVGRALAKLPWSTFGPAQVQSASIHGVLGSGDLRVGQAPSRTVSGSSSGRGRPGSTPTSSRRSSPVPSVRGKGSRNGSKSRSGTPMSVASTQETLFENL